MDRPLTSFVTLALVLAFQTMSVASSTTQPSSPAKPNMSDDSDRITGPAQSSIASTKSFATEPAAKASRALAAIDLDKAFALVGKKGSFEGTVSQAYTTDNNGIVSLDFARDYKTALTAVVFPKDYKKFPNLQLLKGKSVVVSGQFKAYEGRAEIVMTDPKQVTILK